jgi:hypothetical protein
MWKENADAKTTYPVDKCPACHYIEIHWDELGRFTNGSKDWDKNLVMNGDEPVEAKWK